jgi:hypothetical protein
MTDHVENLHPILNEVTKTITELYLHKKDEETRLKLLKLEHLLEEKLKEVKAVKD